MIRNKTIKFNLEKEEDRELWEWLEKLPHGYFSHLTKKVWKDTMDKNIQVDKYIMSEKMKEEQGK